MKNNYIDFYRNCD